MLHPRKLSVYSVSGNTNKQLNALSRVVFESAYQLYFLICVYAGTAGNVEHGVQYQLKLVYEHNLQRTACNMTYGTFGGVTGMDDILNALFGCMLQFLCAGDSHSRRHCVFYSVSMGQ